MKSVKKANNKNFRKGKTNDKYIARIFNRKIIRSD